MKSYTDINQSKLLAEILPKESADMFYCPSYSDDNGNDLCTAMYIEEFIIPDDEDVIPCWSLTVLLAQMPCSELVSSQDNKYRVFWKDKFSEWHTNAVDACVELLERVRKEEER